MPRARPASRRDAEQVAWLGSSRSDTAPQSGRRSLPALMMIMSPSSRTFHRMYFCITGRQYAGPPGTIAFEYALIGTVPPRRPRTQHRNGTSSLGM